VAIAAHRLVDVLGGLVGGAEGRQREQLDGNTGRSQFVAAEQRGGAELGDVGQHRHLHRIDEAAVGIQIVGGLGEDAVGTGLDTGDGTFDGLVHAVHLDGVGARDQEEVRIGLGIGGRLHAVDHFTLRHDLLARTVTAALGANLVLDVAGGRTGLDQRLHGARDVERTRAEAGIDVDHQRQVADIGDAAHVHQHVFQGVDAQVRQAQRAGGNTATRQVDGAEAGALGQQGVVGVDRADHLQRRFGSQRLTEAGTGRERSGSGHAAIQVGERVCMRKHHANLQALDFTGMTDPHQ